MSIKKQDIETMSNADIKLLFTASVHDLPECKAKKYILEGLDDYTMGQRINRVEKISMLIVVDRFLTDKL